MLTPTPRSVTACNIYDTGLFATIFDALTLVPLYTEKSRHTTTLFSNRSDKIRTCGPHVPNVVLYHLSHTPMCSPLFGTAIVIIMAAFRKSKQKILILIRKGKIKNSGIHSRLEYGSGAKFRRQKNLPLPVPPAPHRTSSA